MHRGRASFWSGAAVLIALGAVLRLWFIGHAATITGDTFLYGDIALSWMQHGVYGFSQPPADPIPTLIRLPGYPLFLMLCFRLFGSEHYTAVLFVQSLLDLLACLVLADLARRLFGNRAALPALALAALCPFTASYVAAALTESLTLVCITVSFYALERWRSTFTTGDSGHPEVVRSPWNRWLFVLSAALAYAILLRPEQLLLALALVPAVFWVSRQSTEPRGTSSGLPPALLVGLLTLLPLVPWTVRNARTFHVFQPLAPRSATDPGDSIPGGFNRWYRSWGVDFASTEDIYWNYDGAPIQIADLPNRAFDSSAQFAETAAVLRDYNLTAKPSPELDSRFNHIANERIRASPLRQYMGLPIARLVNMLLRPRVEMLPIPLNWWRWQEHPGQTTIAVAYGALNLAYLAAGCLGLYRWSRRADLPTAPVAWSMIAFVLLRCGLLLTLDNSEPRYTLELFPILILGAAALFRHGTTKTEN